MIKSFKYRIYPTKDQEQKIAIQFGCCRYIYNWGLQRKTEVYQKEQKNLSCIDLINELSKLKKELTWLNDAYSQALQMALRNLDNAYQRFFKEKKGFPKFKSKHHVRQTCQYPQGIKFKENKIYIPKIGLIKIKLHRKFEGNLKTVTLSRTGTNKYYVSLLIDDGKSLPKKQIYSENTTIGVDIGLTHFAILSNGEKIEHPKYLKKSEQKLKRQQQIVSRRKKGSNNRKKAIKRLAIQHEKITNQRNDFLHKLSHRLISENQAIAIETLNIAGMLKNRKLAKSISDLGWNKFFIYLNRKSEHYGKTILKIGRFEASTKICNSCGYINIAITLKDRKWMCPQCQTEHDRDINAAKNIKSIALNKQNYKIPEDSREFTLGELSNYTEL